MELKNCRIVLTGAASGIGRAILHELCAKPGVNIVAADRDEAGLQAAVAEESAAGAQVVACVTDVSVQTQVDDLFTFALEQLGRIDLFIANAGFAYYESLVTPDWARLERIFQTNSISPIYSAVKMRELYGNEPYRVVITSSGMGDLGLPGYAVYGGTKSALIRFAEGYRLELDDPLKLTMLYPIATRTNFFTSAGEDTPFPFTSQAPEEVAQALIVALEKDRKNVNPSLFFNVLMLFDRILPPVRVMAQNIELKNFLKWRAEKEQ